MLILHADTWKEIVCKNKSILYCYACKTRVRAPFARPPCEASLLVNYCYGFIIDIHRCSDAPTIPNGNGIPIGYNFGRIFSRTQVEVRRAGC